MVRSVVLEFGKMWLVLCALSAGAVFFYGVIGFAIVCATWLVALLIVAGGGALFPRLGYGVFFTGLIAVAIAAELVHVTLRLL